MIGEYKKIEYGFIAPKIDETHWVLGASALPRVVLREDGQWDDFLVTDEYQNLGKFEPSACVSFGSLNCVEILLKRLYEI